MSEDLLELSREDFDLLNELPACGCGQPAVVYGLYRWALTVLEYPPNGEWATWEERLAAVGGDERVFYLVAYVLDNIGATDHGNSVLGAWITEKGRKLLEILERFAESGYDAMPCYDVSEQD